MAEQMLICNALDERDFLRKKIEDAISNIKLVSARRKKDTKINSVPVDEYEKNAVSSFQSVKDLINRWHMIDMGITQANATTRIELKSGRSMTRAEAIALRNSLKGAGKNNTNFEGMLLDTMKAQYGNAVQCEQRFNTLADDQCNNYKEGLISRNQSNKELSENEVKLAEKMVEDLYGVLVDPIKIADQIEKFEADYGNLLSELETAIKVSNATTYIEI